MNIGPDNKSSFWGSFKMKPAGKKWTKYINLLSSEKRRKSNFAVYVHAHLNFTLLKHLKLGEELLQKSHFTFLEVWLCKLMSRRHNGGQIRRSFQGIPWAFICAARNTLARRPTAVRRPVAYRTEVSSNEGNKHSRSYVCPYTQKKVAPLGQSAPLPPQKKKTW